MSPPAAVISYPSLRCNTWATDLVELDSTLSAMAAGAYHELDAIVEIAPLVVPTSPPILVALANPDFAWDVQTTPGRLYALLMDIATRCPNITPSVFLETLQLVKSMFVFTWEHPVIVGNMTRELELLFVRTFWNLAVRYYEGFTEELFHELTDSRYVRCLDPSTKLILARTMDLEDAMAKPKPADLVWSRKWLCNAYADWVVEVENKHPYVEPTAVAADIATSVSRVEESVSMEVLPSELESLADVERVLEEALDAEIDLNEELEAEAVDLSTSYSNRAMLGTPTSTASAPAMFGTVSDRVDDLLEDRAIHDNSNGVVPTSEGLDVADEIASQVSLSPVELAEKFIFHYPLPPRLAVRTRPPFGSQSTAASEASLVEKVPKTSEHVEPRPSTDRLDNYSFMIGAPVISTRNHHAPSASSSITTGASTSFGRFFKRPIARGSLLSTANTSSFTTTSTSIRSKPFSAAYSLTASNISKGTWTSATSSSTNASSSSGDSVPTESSLSTDSSRYASDSDTPHSPSSIRKFGTFVKRLVRRCGAHGPIVGTWGTDGLAPPIVAAVRSEVSGTTDVEAGVELMPAYEVLGWDGKPMKPRGSWAKLMGLPRLYWELKMAERRGEA